MIMKFMTLLLQIKKAALEVWTGYNNPSLMAKRITEKRTIKHYVTL
jgi:hypothetical protein